MRRMQLLVLAAISGTAIAQGSGLKAGLWEVTNVRQTTDGRDTTAQASAASSQMAMGAMAHMTPEQRKQMEAMMSGRSDTGGALRRVCISPAMAARDKPFVGPQGNCPPSKFNRSGNKTTFEFNCMKNGIGAVGKGESVVAGDTISTRTDMTLSLPRGSHTMHSETQMKYLGRDCQGIKPLDELGFEESDDETK
jgi:hypothetical protein